jgi:hypothetical protein
VREGKTTGVPKGINELNGRVLENMRDLVGDLLGAKNADVTAGLRTSVWEFRGGNEHPNFRERIRTTAWNPTSARARLTLSSSAPNSARSMLQLSTPYDG